MSGRDQSKNRDGGDPIVDGLRRLYDGVAGEAVPDEFMNLLKKIDEARADKTGQKDDKS